MIEETIEYMRQRVVSRALVLVECARPRDDHYEVSKIDLGSLASDLGRLHALEAMEQLAEERR